MSFPLYFRPVFRMRAADKVRAIGVPLKPQLVSESFFSVVVPLDRQPFYRLKEVVLLTRASIAHYGQNCNLRLLRRAEKIRSPMLLGRAVKVAQAGFVQRLPFGFALNGLIDAPRDAYISRSGRIRSRDDEFAYRRNGLVITPMKHLRCSSRFRAFISLDCIIMHVRLGRLMLRRCAAQYGRCRARRQADEGVSSSCHFE